ncbi:MAG: hypothetical protein WBW71_02330 [Bacteroidota bacterium]
MNTPQKWLNQKKVKEFVEVKPQTKNPYSLSTAGISPLDLVGGAM